MERTVIISRWNGAWYKKRAIVLRWTRTQIVIEHGSGIQRFNRRTGRVIGGRTGRGAMTNPSITMESLAEFNAAVEKAAEVK